MKTIYQARDGKQFSEAEIEEAKKYDYRLSLLETTLEIVKGIDEKYGDNFSEEDSRNVKLLLGFISNETKNFEKDERD